MSSVNVSMVLGCLRELADIDWQRRVWAGSSGPEMSSFAEANCGLYDDSGLGHELDRRDHPVFAERRPVFSEIVDAGFRILRKKLSAIDDTRTSTEIIEDPGMVGARILAKQLLGLLAEEGIS